ncbi:unnamed protein product [Coccothraustes coccothraustes]
MVRIPMRAVPELGAPSPGGFPWQPIRAEKASLMGLQATPCPSPVGRCPGAGRSGCGRSIGAQTQLTAAQREPFALGFLEGPGARLSGQLGPSPRLASSSLPSCFAVRTLPARLRRWPLVLGCFPSRSGRCLHPAAAVTLPTLPGSGLRHDPRHPARRSRRAPTLTAARGCSTSMPVAMAACGSEQQRHAACCSLEIAPSRHGSSRRAAGRSAPHREPPLSERPVPGVALPLPSVSLFPSVVSCLSHFGRNTFPSLSRSSFHLRYCRICALFSSEKSIRKILPDHLFYSGTGQHFMMKKFAQ